MTMKVIGAGFGRTGTASLKIALDKLGFGPCYHMSEVVSNAGHMDLWLDVAAGKPDWPTIFAKYQSTVDFPACSYWRELADYYPDAKLVLSVRDAERWFASTQKTIMSNKMQAALVGSKWEEMLNKTTYSVVDDINDHDKLIAAYNAHNEAVKAAFGPDRLLVYEVKEGWAPLCDFLGVAVPSEPYPQVNSTAEFDAVFEMLDSPLGDRLKSGLGAPEGPMHEELFKNKN